MDWHEVAGIDDRLAALEAENAMLRAEIRVSREAAEITAHLVVEQFEKSEAIMTRLEVASHRLNDKNQALEEANERLLELDKLKSDFLSSVSHELRTPLTSIRGFASLIERDFIRSFMPMIEADSGMGKKAQRIHENLEIILKESERLTRLINDVLDLAKIEAGRTDWHDVSLQIADMVRNAALAASGMYDQKPNIHLCVDVENDLPDIVGDRDRLQQVLVNLLNNAAKFTEHGQVTVCAYRESNETVRIDIKDTGIGFPQDEAELIFDKFQQARQGDTLLDRPKGTGLGLAICREIVNRHGGRIWATSAIGCGSVFSLVLPVDISHASERKSSTVVPDEEKSATASIGARTPVDTQARVLVVDDDPGIRNYFAQLLIEHGYAVETAEDGQAALASARLRMPDLITMDLAMPVMDGRTAISLLRADVALRHVPIIVISAIPGLENAGGDLAMPKPLDERRFVENVNVLLRNEHENAETARKLNFLVLYEEGNPVTSVPERLSARCELTFCPVTELPQRVAAGYQGMVAIPADLLNKINVLELKAAPALEVVILQNQSDAND